MGENSRSSSLKRREDPFVEPCQEEDSESESLKSSRQRSTPTPRGEHREVREEDSTPAIPTLSAASLCIPSTEIEHPSDGEESDEDSGGKESEKDEKSEKSEQHEASSHGSGGYTSRERTPAASTPIVLRERHETRDDRPPLPRRPTAKSKAKAEPEQRPEPIATSSVAGHRLQHTEEVTYFFGCQRRVPENPRHFDDWKYQILADAEGPQTACVYIMKNILKYAREIDDAEQKKMAMSCHQHLDSLLNDGR